MLPHIILSLSIRINHKLNFLPHLLQLLSGFHREAFLYVWSAVIPPLHGEDDGVLPDGPDDLHDLGVGHQGDEDPVDTDQYVPHLQSAPTGRAHQTVDLQKLPVKTTSFT